MVTIEQLAKVFSLAYGHSLYAMEKEEQALIATKNAQRAQIKRKYERERSRISTQSVNLIMAGMHRIKDAYQALTAADTSVIRAAEYLAYGNVVPRNIGHLIFSDAKIPLVIPFLGFRNVYIESNNDDCQNLGLQFTLQALRQTAPGQLSVTVVNPELRSEFSVLTRLPDFKMLTKTSEINDEFAGLSEEILNNDKLLQGRFNSLLDLRKNAKQPVGSLRLLVVQDMLLGTEEDSINSFVRISRSAPRCGMVVLFLSSKVGKKTSKTGAIFKELNNVLSFQQYGQSWRCQNQEYEDLDFEFPLLDSVEINESINKIIEEGKNTKAITIPFYQIEEGNQIWSESSAEHLVFNVGRSGLDNVSVCVGDKVSQNHNILISGAAGKGKSNLLEVMIHSLCIRYSPSELELYLLDFKDGLTFKPYSAKDGSFLPHAKMLGLESDRDIGLAVMKDLEIERKRRARLFSNSHGGVKGYESFRKLNPDVVLPRIVLVIDEYQKLFDVNDDIAEEASALLENLVRQGRACAIHIVLASQSITGAVGLLGKDERIYAQFPVRIALQNTVNESYSIFGIGNDGAAQLRVRGEAIINENYGALDSNRRFTVAYAEPEEMKRLRQSFCERVTEKKYPIIFARKDVLELTDFFISMKKWRLSTNDGGVVRIPLGMLLSVRRDIVSVSFSNEVGKNLAILGNGEDLQAEDIKPGKFNNAIGMLQGIALALALQCPSGDARFVMIDGLSDDVRKNSSTERWLRLMERLGFPIEQIHAEESSEWLISFNQEVKDFGCEENTYIFGFGMDRCSGFADTNLCGECGAYAFQELLKLGNKGVHFLGWWSNVSVFKNHLGFGNDGFINTKVLLRMDTDAARDVLGPFINWGVRENRAYIHDSSDLTADEVVMPLIPVTERVCGMTEAEAW